MSLRKRIIRDEPIPQVAALKKGHAKHSACYSKKRNERFGTALVERREIPKTKREGPVP